MTFEERIPTTYEAWGPFGYTDEIHLTALGLGLAGLVAVFGMGRLGVRSFGVYTITGVLVWLAFHESE